MEIMDIERRPSVSSIGSQGKRRREEEPEVADVDIEQLIAEEVIDIIMNESNKINKGVGKMLLKKYQELAAISVKKGMEVARFQGKLEERESTTGLLPVVNKSYAGVTKAALPKVGKKLVKPKDMEKTVLIYTKDETNKDPEETKKIMKEVLAPRELGIQIRAVKKITKGGLAVEAGTKKCLKD